MKHALCTVTATILLTGCLATNTAKKETGAPEDAQTAKSTEVAAAPAAAPAANGETPCKAETPAAKPAKGKTKAKTTAKTKGKETTTQVSSVPCKPAADKASASANAAPAKAAAASAPASGARREVKGINDWTGYIDGTPAPGSKFNKLQIGMGSKEVMDLIGAPTDQQSHVTGKAWIPFYAGSGTYETHYYYKGHGRLIFAGNGGFSTGVGLIGIEHDANEKGYSR